MKKLLLILSTFTILLSACKKDNITINNYYGTTGKTTQQIIDSLNNLPPNTNPDYIIDYTFSSPGPLNSGSDGKYLKVNGISYQNYNHFPFNNSIMVSMESIGNYNNYPNTSVTLTLYILRQNGITYTEIYPLTKTYNGGYYDYKLYQVIGY